MSSVTLFFFFFVGVALLVIASKSIVNISPDERAVVFRLGKFAAVHSPGVVMIVPFLDKVVKVKVEQIAGYDRMNEDQLLEKIAEIYTQD